MAVTEKAGGTQTATVTTEHTLTTITAEGVFQLVVDLDNMVNADELELRADLEVRAGGTAKTLFFATYADDQGADNVIAISPPIPKVVNTDLIFTLLQAAGTSRDFIWSVYEYENA
jgi:hypothetical protein